MHICSNLRRAAYIHILHASRTLVGLKCPEMDILTAAAAIAGLYVCIRIYIHVGARKLQFLILPRAYVNFASHKPDSGEVRAGRVTGEARKALEYGVMLAV